jgi:hypothetical protein
VSRGSIGIDNPLDEDEDEDEEASGRLQETPGDSQMPQEAPGGSRRLQEALEAKSDALLG